MRRYLRGARSLLIGGITLSAAGPAWADYCGTTADGAGHDVAGAGWNVPKGAAVFSVSKGPIQAVLNAVGEVRTHSMLSTSYKSMGHSTMHTPDPKGAFDSNVEW